MFSALNESSNSENEEADSEIFTREIQEEEAYSLYKLALSSICLQQYEEASIKLKKVLDLPFVARIRPLDEETEEKGPVTPPLKLKYLVFKNLALIAIKQKDYKNAVDAYLEALEVDPTDVSVWYEMGVSSLHISNYPLSRLAFEEGFKRYPNHWPCLDNLITVTYVLNDYANCLYYISRGLEKEHGYVKALAFKDKIFEEDPYLKQFCEGYFSNCNPCIHISTYDKEDAEEFIQEALNLREKKKSLIKPTILPVVNLKQPLKEYTWKALGESLIATYDYISSSDPFISLSCKINLAECLTESISEEKDVSELPETCLAMISNSDEQYPKDQVGLLQLSSSVTSDQLNHQGTTADYSMKTESDETQNCDSHHIPSTYTLPLNDCAVPSSDPLFCTDTCFGNKRAPKRKLSDTSEKSGKRRSMRVRNPTTKRHHDNVNYQELLQQFLPLRFFEVTDDAEDNNEIPNNASSGDHTYGQSAESAKGNDKNLISTDVEVITSSEKDEVHLFITEHQTNGGIIDLLYKYVIKLGARSTCSWPKTLLNLFSFTFLRLRKHIVMPNLFCHEVDNDFIKDTGIAVLTFSELKVDQWYLNTGHSSSSSSSSFSPKLPYTVPSYQIGPDSIGKNFHADMEFLMQLTVQRDVLNEDWLDFVVRVLWLKAKFHSVEGEVDMAVSCLDRLVDVLQKENETSLKVIVANSYFSNVITLTNVQQQLELLQRCQSLEEVQRLYDRGAYQAVVDLLVVTFRPNHSKTKISTDGNVPERHAQLILLQDSLLKLKNYQECVQWTEVAFNEALQQFFNVPSTTARNDWSDTMAHLLSGFESCIKVNSNLLNGMSISKLSRFSQNLILLICILMDSYDIPSESSLTVLPWIVLYRLIVSEETSCDAAEQSGKTNSSDSPSEKNINNKNLQPKGNIVAASVSLGTKINATIPISIMLLLTAHECLGRRTYCCSSNGLFLLHCVDVMINELQNNSKDSGMCREDLEHGLEQCFYCLYAHPSRRTKAKHLQEHNSQQISLTWKCAVQIYDYFKPDILPEFDSYRTSTISSELENLLKRIALLVPPSQDPSNLVDSYTAYIEGGVDNCPKFSPNTPAQNLIVKDLHYLLGDYYFKNKEFSKAARYYLLDICINPDRQDSWAGMALSRSSQLEQKLNSYEVRNEGTIYRKSSAALRCFEHALQLNPYTTSLWIEYGSLAYVLHSHASRQLKQGSYFDGPRDLLKNKRDEMLVLAERCFLEANKTDDGSDPEEAWLHHYMLGKISQKQRREPSVFLDHYRKSLMYLHEDEARYPTKIQYHNPPEFSIEVLEVFYRIHTSCLKILTKFENIGMPQQQLKLIMDCIRNVSAGPFMHFQEKEKCASSSESEYENIQIQPEVNSENKISSDHNYSNKKNVITMHEIENIKARTVNDSTLDPDIADVVNYLLRAIDDQVPIKYTVKRDSSSVMAYKPTSTEQALAIQTNAQPDIPLRSKISHSDTSSSRKGPLRHDDQSFPSAHIDLEVKLVVDSILKELEHSETETIHCLNSSSSSKSKEASEFTAEDFESVLTVFNEILYCIQQNKEYIFSNNPNYQSTSKVSENMQKKDVASDQTSVMIQGLQKFKGCFGQAYECSKKQDALPSKIKLPKKEVESVKTLCIEETGQGTAIIGSCKPSGGNAKLLMEKLSSSDVPFSSRKPISEKIITSVEKPLVCETKETHEKSFMSIFSCFVHNEAANREKDEMEESKRIISELIHMCLDALRECLKRFIQHYKSLYRIAFYHCYSCKNKNLQWAREILLAATPGVKNYPPMPGLFAERKNTNFFNGIWHAPSNEIDRPGSFGAHMFRSVRLLVDVLSQQMDYNMLLYVTQQLHRTPDFGKKYMRDAERILLARESYSHCVTILREQMNSLLQEEPPPEESRLTCCLLEIYRTYQTLTKACIYPNDTNELLEEAYKMYKLGEVDPNPSILQQAITFCQRQLGKSYQLALKPADMILYRNNPC